MLALAPLCGLGMRDRPDELGESSKVVTYGSIRMRRSNLTFHLGGRSRVDLDWNGELKD